MGVIRWDPFRELNALQDRMNRLFEEAGRGSGAGDPGGAAWSPDVDIYETDTEMIIQAELPGLDREAIGLGLQDDVLTLSGNRPLERLKRQENYHRVERSYGQFHRSFAIPPHVSRDSIQAEYASGVLTITLPKTRKTESRQIRISS